MHILQTINNTYFVKTILTLRTNQTFNLTKNKIENNILIFFVESTKSKQTIMINNCEKQYVSQIAVVALIVEENLYENNISNVVKFIKILQNFNALIKQRQNNFLTMQN